MSLPIRLRLALVGAALIATLVGAFGAFVYFRLEADLVAAADDSLAERAQALLDGPPAGPDIPVGESDVGDIFAAILGRDGVIISSTADFPTAALIDPARGSELQVVDDGEIRTHARRHDRCDRAHGRTSAFRQDNRVCRASRGTVRTSASSGGTGSPGLRKGQAAEARTMALER